MKRKIILVVALAIILITGIIAIIITLNKDKKVILITYDNYYSYVYLKDKTMNFKVYINKDEHELLDIDSYSYITISSKDEKRLLSLDLTNVVIETKESFEGKEYTKFSINALIPELSNDYSIADFLLNIYLNNSDEYHLEMGDISLKYYGDVGMDKAFYMSSLYAVKDLTKYVSRIRTITIEGSLSKDIKITNISIGLLCETSYTVLSDKIEITVEYKEMTMNNVPIFISFQDGLTQDIQVIDNFIYFDDYNVLGSNAPILNIVK